MTALNKQAELRKELSNPAIGSNHHLRKLALSLLDDLYGKEGRIKELDSQRALAFMACNRWRDKFNEAEAKLEAAEKRIAEQREYYEGVIADGSRRIAELEEKLANPVLLPKTNGYWTEQEKAYEEAITLAKRQVRLAGFSVEDM